jgi:hypothetical protein
LRSLFAAPTPGLPAPGEFVGDALEPGVFVNGVRRVLTHLVPVCKHTADTVAWPDRAAIVAASAAVSSAASGSTSGATASSTSGDAKLSGDAADRQILTDLKRKYGDAITIESDTDVDDTPHDIEPCTSVVDSGFADTIPDSFLG